MNGNPNGRQPHHSTGSSQGGMDNRTLLAVLLIGLGALLLLGRLSLNPLAYLWPFTIIAPGAAFLYAAWESKTDDGAGLIFPGVIVTGTGVLLLYQSVTGHWASWAYAWTLYPAMVGYAMTVYGNRTGKRDDVHTGRAMLRYALMGGAALAVFFELLVFSGWGLMLLILGGLVLFALSQRDDFDLANWMDDTRERVEQQFNGDNSKRKHKPKREDVTADRDEEEHIR